jgi:hypothetical protein
MHASLREENLPTVFLPATQPWDPTTADTFELRTAVRRTPLIPSVRAAVASVNSAIPRRVSHAGTAGERLNAAGGRFVDLPYVVT